MNTPESLARRALTRLRRAAEKTIRELDSLEGALQSAEGTDFPEEAYAGVRNRLEAVLGLCDEEESRLRDKILHAGGLEPGRVRRSSAR